VGAVEVGVLRLTVKKGNTIGSGIYSDLKYLLEFVIM
jgi:hypothetical protein